MVNGGAPAHPRTETIGRRWGFRIKGMLPEPPVCRNDGATGRRP